MYRDLANAQLATLAKLVTCGDSRPAGKPQPSQKNRYKVWEEQDGGSESSAGFSREVGDGRDGRSTLHRDT